jgi:spore germination cell wall hydrolase CwlJ-like protein
MKNYADLGLIVFLAALFLSIVLTWAVWAIVRYYQTAELLSTALEDVADLTDEVGLLSSTIDIDAAVIRSHEAENTQLVKKITQLRKDISEIQDELTTSRSERRPFDPKSAGASRVLAQIVAAECGPTATYDECRMVAQVIVNRSTKYHKTILEIVTDPEQFAPVTSGAWLWATPTPVETAAAYNAVNSIDTVNCFGDPNTYKVLYFCAAGHEDEFFRTKLVLDRRIGDTAFYREKEG